MADRASQLARSTAPITDFERPGLSLKVESDLGIAKLRVCGPDPAARFEALAGNAPPPARGQVEYEGLTFAWMSPAEWLVLGTGPAVADWLDAVAAKGDEDALAVEITDARTSFLLSGADARDALAAHCPLDLWDKSFPIDAVARSMLGDTTMFIVRRADHDGIPRFRVVVDQTMAAYVARLLDCRYQAALA